MPTAVPFARGKGLRARAATSPSVPTREWWLEGNATKGPIFIEDNNDKINFANIWARDVPAIVSDMVVALAGEPDVYP